MLCHACICRVMYFASLNGLPEFKSAAMEKHTGERNLSSRNFSDFYSWHDIGPQLKAHCKEINSIRKKRLHTKAQYLPF